MSFFRKNWDYIYHLDMIAPKVEFSHNGKSSFTSLSGVVATLLIVLFTLLTARITIKDLIYQTNPKITEDVYNIEAGEEIIFNEELVNSTFIQFYTFDPTKLRAVEINITEFPPPLLQYAQIESTGRINFLSKLIPMEPCSKEFFEYNYLNTAQLNSYQRQNISFVLDFLTRSSFCFPKNSNFTLSYLEDFRLLVNLFNNHRQKALKYPVLIMQISSKMLIVDRNNYKNPINTTWYQDMINLAVDSVTLYDYFITNKKISVFDPSFMFENLRYENSYNLKETLKASTILGPANNVKGFFDNLPMTQVNLRQSYNKNEMEIRYVTFDDLLSVLGGTFSVMAMIFEIFHGFIMESIFKAEMINSVFSLHKNNYFKDNKFNDKKNINFVFDNNSNKGVDLGINNNSTNRQLENIDVICNQSSDRKMSFDDDIFNKEILKNNLANQLLSSYCNSNLRINRNSSNDNCSSNVNDEISKHKENLKNIQNNENNENEEKIQSRIFKTTVYKSKNEEVKLVKSKTNPYYMQNNLNISLTDIKIDNKIDCKNDSSKNNSQVPYNKDDIGFDSDNIRKDNLNNKKDSNESNNINSFEHKNKIKAFETINNIKHSRSPDKVTDTEALKYLGWLSCCDSAKPDPKREFVIRAISVLESKMNINNYINLFYE